MESRLLTEAVNIPTEDDRARGFDKAEFHERNA